MKAQEVYETTTARIVSALADADPNDWRAPWHCDGGEWSTFTPYNVTTGNPYHGGNTLALYCAAEAAGYGTGEWATFKQWQAVGARVRKGERASYGVKWVAREAKEDDDGRRRGSLFPVGFAVFNAGQVDGWERPEPVDTGATPIESAETFIRRIGADVRYGANRAYYERVADRITVPELRQFVDAEAFYSTLAHEHVHWTGAPHRLDRVKGSRFGDDAYAYEELVAELGAAFVSARLGIANEPRPDHAQYLASWLKVLRSDVKAIYSAASEAQKATDLLFSLAEGGEVSAAA